MSTLTEVLYEEGTQAASDQPVALPFSTLLQRQSYAACDNSGSTGGATLRVAQAFVNEIQVRRVSLWNSTCNPPVPLESVGWRSCGGTEPHTVFEPVCHVPQNASCFIFMTDGQVWSTTRLARHASVTAHLPSLLIIFRYDSNYASQRVAQYNVSVVMAHFTAARTAAVLILNSDTDTRGRLVAVKGDWAQVLEQPPPLTDSLLVGDCPLVSIQQLRQLPSRVYQPAASGTIPLQEGRVLNLDALLRLQDGRELVTQLSDEELEDIARAFLVQGNLSTWRSLLNQWLVRANQEAALQVQERTQQATSGIHALLRRMHASEDPQEEQALLSQVQTAIHENALAAEESMSEANRSARQARSILNTALAAVTALEASGMSATSLGRLSNRAARANTVDRANLASLASLDTRGAPEEEDLVLRERGPVALCLRAMSETDHNTSDAALNEALREGQVPENAVFEPTIVSLEIADRIEEMDASPLTRQLMSVCLPIVSLEDAANRRAVFHRLCIVFMNELTMSHAWLIALSSILRTLETESWANRNSTTGRLLQWFAGQIMQHVVLPNGARLSPDRAQPINEALASIHQSEILTVHSSVEEASVILRLLHRFGAPAAVTDTGLRRALLARIAAAVPQMHRFWLQMNSTDPWADQGTASLSSLMTALYDTRVGVDGAQVPISGTGRLVTSLNGLLSPGALYAVSAFARAMNLSMEDFVVPGLTLVVAGTLDRVTSPHISSTAAVQLVRTANPVVAAEMEPATAGSTSVEDAMDVVRRRLAWARTPLTPLSPFATPFGPSVLFFYASDGSIVDMTQGFEIIPGEAEEARDEQLLRLTEHLRAARGQLMARYFGTLPTGAFTTGTVVSPIHRAMADEFNETATNVDLTQPDAAASFVHRVVQRIVGRSGSSAGNVHGEHLERSAAVLLPSLLESVASFPNLDVQAEPRPVPLLRRVTLELGNRSPDALGEPSNPVWVPIEDPELMETLLRVQQERERARVAALRRRAGNRNAAPVPVDSNQEATTLSARSLANFQRRMTWYLRHGATSMRPDGFVSIESMLEEPDVDGARMTLDNVLEICERDAKGRFSVREEGVLLIRANQGHTIATVDPEQLMTPIEDAADVPVCLHGTYEAAMENIVRSGGLNRMQRQAIQMAVGLPNDPEVRSGIRRNVDLVIYTDVDRAMRQGLRFYRSENNVICCPGPIPVDCFIKVVRLRDGSLIDFNSM